MPPFTYHNSTAAPFAEIIVTNDVGISVSQLVGWYLDGLASRLLDVTKKIPIFMSQVIKFEKIVFGC